MENHFVICINNKDYPVSLEFGKIYRMIQDKEAKIHNYIRVIDESGEDYAYSAERFFAIDLPQEIEEVLLSSIKT